MDCAKSDQLQASADICNPQGYQHAAHEEISSAQEGSGQI